jgi:DNA-binding ferritin-like protein
MSETPDRHFLEALTSALDPYLSADAKKSARALRGILDLFPGQSLADVEKAIKGLLASSQNSVPALAERARALVGGTSAETAEAIVQTAGKLGANDLKQLAKALGLALTGTKPQMVADLRAWLESGGRIAPLTAKDKAMQRAKEYADALAERMRSVDGRAAEDIIAMAEEAGKDKALGVEGFKEFARLLGVTVSGTKPKMLKQFKDVINQMAVTHGQTQF